MNKKRFIIAGGASAIIFSATLVFNFRKADIHIEPGPSVQSRAVQGAPKKIEEEKVARLVSDLGSGNPGKRLKAVTDLGFVGNSASRDALMEHFVSENDLIIRARIISSLRAVQDEKIEKFLIKVMDGDPEPGIRSEAVSALRPEQSTLSFDAIVARIPKEPDVGVRRIILIQLSDRNNPKMLDVLKKWHGKEKDIYLKIRIGRIIAGKEWWDESGLK